MHLDRTKRTKILKWWETIDKPIIITVITLMVTGIALLMAASPAVAQRIGYEPFYFVKRQMIFLILGSGIILFHSLIDNISARRISILGFLACIILLIIVEFAGYETKGARRWIKILGFSLQPSEIIKPFFAVFTAWILTRKNIETNFPGYTFSVIASAILIILIIRQPDFGMTLSLVAIWFTQLVIGGLNLIFVFSGLLFGLAGVILAYLFLPHVKNRLDVFLDAKSGDNYQTSKSLQAFENGGIFGTGPGQGRIKEILPDSHTDFIFSVAGEEFGLIFCLAIISLYLFLILRCLHKAYNSNDLFIILAISGLAVQIFFQAAVNMGVAINLLPNTGMTLPLVSYGGSSMISTSFAIGLILTFTKKKFG